MVPTLMEPTLTVPTLMEPTLTVHTLTVPTLMVHLVAPNVLLNRFKEMSLLLFGRLIASRKRDLFALVES